MTKVRSGWRKEEDSPFWKGDDVLEASGRVRAQKKFKNAVMCNRCKSKKKPIDRHHKDGNTRNNNESNIEFLCRKCHMKLDGRSEKLGSYSSRSGESNPRAKLKASDVLKIVQLKSDGWKVPDIAALFDVSVSTIWMLLRGETWKSIPR